MRPGDLAASPGLVIHPILKRTQTPGILDRLRGCDMIRVEVSPYRLAWSRTQAFQAWYMGSNPVRGTNHEPGPVPGFLLSADTPQIRYFCHPIAELVRMDAHHPDLEVRAETTPTWRRT